MSVIAHCLVDEQAFKEAVWSIDRSSFRPGDALNALERAKVKGAEPSTTQGAVEALRKLAEIHHGTIRPSKLHDPHNRDWTECECTSCRLAQPFGGQ